MVTRQSANQLKTPAKVSWVFKMVSQFGSLGYTIMGKTADLTVVQKTIIDTLHKEGKPQTFIVKEAVHRVLYPSIFTESWVEGKDAQPTDRTAALWGLSSKINSRIWVKFTRNGLRLGSRHQESPHTDVSRNLATVVVRGVLPGLREEELDCCPVVQSPKSAKRTRSWLNDHDVGVLDWPANSPDLNPRESNQEEKGETRDQKMQMSWRPLSKKPGLHTTSAVPQTDHLHATPNWGSN